MENIHTLDSETVESLTNMFNSCDEENIRMALTILNNADFNDNKVVEFVNELNNECTGLHFALFQNKKGDIRARFSYIIVSPNKNLRTTERYKLIDDDSSFDNNEGWIPYEPYNDLSQNFKFNYK